MKYLVIDSLFNALKNLGINVDLVWSIINHIQGVKKLEGITSYDTKLGTAKEVADMVTLSETDICYYETKSADLYIVSTLNGKYIQFKLKLDGPYYVLEMVE